MDVIMDSDAPMPSTSSDKIEVSTNDDATILNEREEEEAAQICFETIVKLLTDPPKMCSLLKLHDYSLPPQPDDGPKLPQLILSLRQAFTHKTILARAARHFQNMTDDSLYYLTSMIPVSRNMEEVLRMVVDETHCMTPDGLSKLIQYLCDLLAEIVPKRYRVDKMIEMSEAELQEAEKSLPTFEGDYNIDDWLSLCTSYVRGGSYQLFDSSNITLSEVLKEFAAQYKGRIHEDLWNCSKNTNEYRVSDLRYQKAYTCADVVNYEKIYNLLGTMAGCRNVTSKDIDKMDAAVVMNIFQEMEEVIATQYDMLSRQMPILREQMKSGEAVPDNGFNADGVEKIEANIGERTLARRCEKSVKSCPTWQKVMNDKCEKMKRASGKKRSSLKVSNL